MNRTIKSRVKKFFLLTLLIPLLGFLSALSGVTPSGTYNFTAMYIALGLNTILLCSGFIHILSPTGCWWARYIASSLFLLCIAGVGPLNWISASLPDWRWLIPLAGMYILAMLLPFVNSDFSGLLRRVFTAPELRLQRFILSSAWAIALAAGVFGVAISKTARHIGSGTLGYSIFGFGMHILLVWGTVSMAHQAWELRPQKKPIEE